MKLSNETLSVLKNFASINQGILFKPGKTIRTISTHKNILAEAVVSEEIPKEFGVYDLNNFCLKTDLGLKREKKACKRTNIYKYNLFVRGSHARTALNIRFQCIIPH